MGEFVRERMSDHRLHYHNIQHVMRLYAKAAEWRLPYDANLDAAILWHDAVYDELHHKEYRSAMLMRETAEAHPDWFDGLDVTLVFDMIMSTATHEVVPDKNSLMIKLDLAELADPVRRRDNFWSILEESRALYGITQKEAAAGTEKFMRAFLRTVQRNHVEDWNSNSFHYDGDGYWDGVVKGVSDVITTAVTVQEACDRIQLT
jgi:predicted metal-dependent HD superfamily phosphohydrolase